jgi:hypothetical protein
MSHLQGMRDPSCDQWLGVLGTAYLFDESGFQFLHAWRRNNSPGRITALSLIDQFQAQIDTRSTMLRVIFFCRRS